MNIETLQYKNLSLSSWDVGGRGPIRLLWRHYLQGIHGKPFWVSCRRSFSRIGIIYVVDSNDNERLSDASEELNKTLKYLEEGSYPPILVFANKQDLPNAQSISKITEGLDLHNKRFIFNLALLV